MHCSISLKSNSGDIAIIQYNLLVIPYLVVTCLVTTKVDTTTPEIWSTYVHKAAATSQIAELAAEALSAQACSPWQIEPLATGIAEPSRYSFRQDN